MSSSKRKTRNDKIREFIGVPDRKRRNVNPEPEDKEDEQQGSQRSTGPAHSDPDLETEMGPTYLDGEMPSYNFISKLARECLLNGYKLGTWRFDCNSELSEDLRIYSFGAGSSNTVMGGFEFNEKFGMFQFSQAFRTDGLYGTLGVRSEIFEGLGLSKLRAIYKKDEQGDSSGLTLDVQAALEFDPFKIEAMAPIINGSLLSSYILYEPTETWLFSFGVVADIHQMKLPKYEFGVGYRSEEDDTELGLMFANLKNVKASIFQRVTNNTALALMANMNDWQDLQISVGGQYELDEEHLIKARICNTGYAGVVYQFEINENCTFSCHVGLNVMQPTDGSHAFGVACSLSG